MSFKTDAFVLRSRTWYGADRIYDLFTPHEGVINAVLKSAAKSKSKLAGHLLPFAKVRIMIGRGRMDHLAGVSIIKDFSEVRNSLRNLSLASSLAELFLNEGVQSNKQEEFILFENVLSYLDDVQVTEEQKLLLVRIFLWKYLSISGWHPKFDQGIMYISPGNRGQTVSSELYDFLQFVIKADWTDFADLSINQRLNKEWLKISQVYYQTIYDRPSQALKLLAYG
jgi:hypothetical protein